MKIRSGFVSNSSSSSFIAGIGIIKDKEKFTKMLAELKEKHGGKLEYGCNIRSTSEVLSPEEAWEVRQDGSKAYVTAATNAEPEVSVSFDPSADESFFVVDFGNNEGDNDFWNEEFGEMEYDKVDRDWFVGGQKEILEILENRDLFKEVDHILGAGRDG